MNKQKVKEILRRQAYNLEDQVRQKLKSLISNDFHLESILEEGREFFQKSSPAEQENPEVLKENFRYSPVTYQQKAEALQDIKELETFDELEFGHKEL